MDDKVKYLLSLGAIRDRAKIVGEAARAGKLSNFDVHEERMDDVADFVTRIIKRDYGPDKYNTIPTHGRWQHFEVGGVPRINELLSTWKSEGVDDVETTRRLIDLFFVSVLLDAGAGDHWRYQEPESSNTYERSEGIAVASLWMFKAGAFQKGTGGVRVDGKGLEELSTAALAEGLQVDEKNPMAGFESRADLLRKLGTSFLAQKDVFGEDGRPGNIVDHLTASSPSTLDVLPLWDILQTLLIPIWPQDRTTVNGHAIGDAWPLSTLKNFTTEANADQSTYIQPFHKLTQWLTYSLMVPFTRILSLPWTNTSALTALPEYRNGGLFVDLGALTLKPEALKRGLAAPGSKDGLPIFHPGDDVIVEWRAMTLVLIEQLHSMVLKRLDGVELSLAQVIEAGTWISGREVAKRERPATKSSPILIESDGTVF